MKEVILLTGGNLGNRQENLAQAKLLIEQRCGNVIKSSSLFETAPWGKTNQPNFLNQVLIVETGLHPIALLEAILGIETDMGRTRGVKNDARTIDIDILYFGQEIHSEPFLSIPHPEIKNRRFVLVPLNEIAPNFIDPVHQQSINQLLTSCTDMLEVHKFEHG